MKKLQTINFNKETLDWIKSEAKRQDRSVSWIVNNIAEEKMSKRDLKCKDNQP